jgi:hypothetical protein
MRGMFQALLCHAEPDISAVGSTVWLDTPLVVVGGGTHPHPPCCSTSSNTILPPLDRRDIPNELNVTHVFHDILPVAALLSQRLWFQAWIGQGCNRVGMQQVPTC